ncbi:MAG: Lpg1974 family pore-forming outer membrane protein [Planctomycetaceae bacterium]
MNPLAQRGVAWGLIVLCGGAAASAQSPPFTPQSSQSPMPTTNLAVGMEGRQPALHNPPQVPGGPLPPLQGPPGQYSAFACDPTFDSGPMGNACGCPAPCDGMTSPGFHAGAELLFIRPHFSEAVGFARGRQTPTSISVDAQELEFDYETSPRLSIGYRPSCRDDLRFTYWRFDGETNQSGRVTPGEFIVDPFGNVVGAVAVVDPRDGRFLPPAPFGPGPTVLIGGDLIRTEASVETNVYDLEYRRSVLPRDCRWALDWSAGVRIADINQGYESSITTAGAPTTLGDFSVDFIGAGPRVGLAARRGLGGSGWSLFANSHGSLLVGEYEVQSGNRVFLPFPFQARQEESMTRTIPVVETMLGTSWQPTDWITVSAGWEFQAWFDFGTSGGTFGGFFTGSDDANIMSFDGVSLAVEVGF